MYLRPKSGYKLLDKKNSAGFSLIELLVVLAIMGGVLLALSINLNSTRNSRDLNIAENELVSNIKKAQSYTLSARALPNGQLPSYYVLKFNLNQGQYFLQSIYNTTSNPKLIDIETIYFPKNVILGSVGLMPPSNITVNPNSCLLLALKLPFGRFYANGVNTADTPGNCSGSESIGSGDHYNDFLLFVTNSPSSRVSTDFSVTLTLISQRDPSLTRWVKVNGVTGVVTFQ
jgi:prepilin-type N-terminal cleavage/methylation domain-containing protein